MSILSKSATKARIIDDNNGIWNKEIYLLFVFIIPFKLIPFATLLNWLWLFFSILPFLIRFVFCVFALNTGIVILRQPLNFCVFYNNFLTKGLPGELKYCKYANCWNTKVSTNTQSRIWAHVSTFICCKYFTSVELLCLAVFALSQAVIPLLSLSIIYSLKV